MQRNKESKLEEIRLKELKPANRKYFALFYTNKPAKATCQDIIKEYF